ncbi:MAG: hypothetical protein ACLFPL_00590 [Candidatus Nanoarchaeia archaeon]
MSSKINNSKKSQGLSADLIVVVSILLLSVLFVVFNQINTQEERNFEEVRAQSQTASNLIFSYLSTQGIVGENNAINVEELKQINVEEIRRSLDIDGDFAIAFERDGELIYIDSQTNFSCIGSDKIIINNENCRSQE